jgi:hypothetical protein
MYMQANHKIIIQFARRDTLDFRIAINFQLFSDETCNLFYERSE